MSSGPHCHGTGEQPQFELPSRNTTWIKRKGGRHVAKRSCLPRPIANTPGSSSNAIPALAQNRAWAWPGLQPFTYTPKPRVHKPVCTYAANVGRCSGPRECPAQCFARFDRWGRSATRSVAEYFTSKRLMAVWQQLTKFSLRKFTK